MIVSCGEALIDFVPARTTTAQHAYVPRPGGSPFNVAVTIGRLGVPAGFLGSVSTDFFGQQLADALAASKVVTRYLSRLERPSTLAFVNLVAAEPEYTFYSAEAAHRFWEPAGELGDDVSMLHFGSLSLIEQPAADRYAQLMARNRGKRILSLDPNIRPTVAVGQETAYRDRLATMLRLADIVKISRADLEWLEPQRDAAACAQAWLADGVSLVVITAGADGATAYAHDGPPVYCPAQKSVLADTVGAGDSFMGALLAGLDLSGVTNAKQLPALDPATVLDVVAFATRVSAITCSRVGADPPWRGDVMLPAVATRNA